MQVHPELEQGGLALFVGVVGRGEPLRSNTRINMRQVLPCCRARSCKISVICFLDLPDLLDLPAQTLFVAGGAGRERGGVELTMFRMS